MRRRIVRALLLASIVVAVVLVPACEMSDGSLQITGPSMSPEVSTAIAVAASFL